MLFNSFEFALFLPIVLLLYWRVLRHHQNRVLLVGSYIFYGAWDWRLLSLIIISTLTDFIVAKRIADTPEPSARKRLILVSLIVNLGILGFFKYFNFFVDSAADLLATFGLEPTTPTLTILLPVGISFYTFQTLGYSIDVYRGRIRPEADLLTFAVYVAYFPQLVAGPIERASRLLPQLQGNRTSLSMTQIRSGILLIVLGLFKKVVIADGLASFVDVAFNRAETGSWVRLLVGLYAFALQIYGDFSGYSSIARGVSRLLGIELMINFRQPYLARNITHFWRTWHISLSTWLRDYLYVPLGGNRRGRLLVYRNLALTMLLGGLWHGAAWTFVIWGGLHGLYLAVHRGWRHQSPKEADEPVTWRDVPAILVTFHLVCLAWIFFRADSLGQAVAYLRGIVTFRGGGADLDAIALLIPLLLMVLVLDLAQRNLRDQEALLRWPLVPQGVVYGLMAAGLVAFSGGDAVPFIYFQF